MDNETVPGTILKNGFLDKNETQTGNGIEFYYSNQQN